MLLKFVMTIGVPGCGKSTYCTNYIRQFPGTVYLSSDAVRGEIYGAEDCQGDSSEVFGIMQQRAVEALRAGKDVLFDATNIKASLRRETLDLVRDIPGCFLKAVVFKVPLWLCLERNAARDRRVPEKVIRRMRRNMELPGPDEGFGQVRYIYK